MSEGVASGYTQKNAGNWLAKARLLIEEIPAIRAQSVEARGHARWFPTARKNEAEEIYIQGIALEHTVVQILTIARTLFDSSVSGGIADSLDQNSPALRDVVTPDEPAAARDLGISARGQIARLGGRIKRRARKGFRK